MGKYHCFTYLDAERNMTWPTKFVETPRVGDYVQATGGQKLQVKSITHGVVGDPRCGTDEPIILVELNK